MPPEHRRYTGDVGGLDARALCFDLCFDLSDGFLHVDGISVGHCIEDEAKGSELLFLPLPQRVANFTAVAVVDFPRELMSKLLPIELDEDPPAELRIINVVEDMRGYCSAQPPGLFNADYLV